MMIEALCPRVQNSEEADLSSETLGIGGHFQKSPSDGTEQKAINDLWVLQGEGCQFVRQSKYNMRIGNRQELLFAVGKPLVACPGVAFWAMPVAA